jgi:hypothetical protein
MLTSPDSVPCTKIWKNMATPLVGAITLLVNPPDGTVTVGLDAFPACTPRNVSG